LFTPQAPVGLFWTKVFSGLKTPGGRPRGSPYMMTDQASSNNGNNNESHTQMVFT